MVISDQSSYNQLISLKKFITRYLEGVSSVFKYSEVEVVKNRIQNKEELLGLKPININIRY